MTYERRAVVQESKQGPRGTVPWSTHLLAWEYYRAAGHGSQSAERIAARGGFSYREMQCALAGHYSECPWCSEEHPEPPGFVADAGVRR